MEETAVKGLTKRLAFPFAFAFPFAAAFDWCVSLLRSTPRTSIPAGALPAAMGDTAANIENGRDEGDVTTCIALREGDDW